MRKTLLLAALAGALLLAGCGPGGTASAPAASVPADVSSGPGAETSAGAEASGWSNRLPVSSTEVRRLANRWRLAPETSAGRGEEKRAF